LTEEDKKNQEIPQKPKRPYAGGALLIAITAFIVILFTGGIAYGVQSVIGGGDENEGILVGGVREFRISASQWSYGPGIIRVNPGEAVRFIVTSVDITHGFAINEMDVNLPLAPSGEIAHEVVIPEDIPEGTYTMYCSIFCGIGHPYMKGSIIVGTPGVGIGKILPYAATLVMGGIFAAFLVIGRRKAR